MAKGANRMVEDERNEGKTAWLFIGILSRADWIGGVITDDELAVLIICACSSRNLLIKHHLNRTCLTSECNTSCIWSKEIQEKMRNKIIDMYQSGKGYKAISKALELQRTTVRAIIHKWRKLGTVVNLPRSGRPTKITPRVQWRLIQEVIKEPRTTSKELQASLASIKVSVHDSTIRKRLGKNGIHGRVPRQKPLLTKKNTKARLTFAKKYLDYPKTFGKYSVDWCDKSWTFWKVCVLLHLA